MRRIAIIGLVIFILGCSSKPQAWEHGWKMRRVVATRCMNPWVGQNIEFTFPLDPGNCDRQEIFDFLESKGGSILEGGGYEGAPIDVLFKDVTDKESADKKILTILPELNALMAKL